MRPYTFLYMVVVVMLFSSCYEEFTIYPDPQNSCFNFTVTPWQEHRINASRGLRLTFNDTLPTLYLSNDVYKIDRFAIRGETTLRYRRKSFSVNLDDNLFVFIQSENKEREIEEFKLISLVFDYTYIENCIAIGLFRKLDLWPVYSAYTEVRLNDHTQGLYLFIEDPVEHFFYFQGSDFVLRRGYNHYIDKQYINDTKIVRPAGYYISRFNSIYSCIANYSGRALYDSLSMRMDLTQYFKKLSVDMLLQNGDYTDEVFFYYKEGGDQGIFGIFPWDYDDIFAEAPHEIGRNWAPGTVFGTRVYNSVEDVIADVGFKLLYSIEDDLDYMIAKDDFLYQQYLAVLESVLDSVDIEDIEEIIDETREQIGPFYEKDSIISQSRYDENPTNQELFTSNLEAKRQFLVNRRNWILEMLSHQKK